MTRHVRFIASKQAWRGKEFLTSPTHVRVLIFKVFQLSQFMSAAQVQGFLIVDIGMLQFKGLQTRSVEQATLKKNTNYNFTSRRRY
jgi:hypothetical protein